MLFKPLFSKSAQNILKDRYYWKDEHGNPTETAEQMLLRIAKHIAGSEKTDALKAKWTDEYYNIMAPLYFLPNSPTIMNAGRPSPHGQLAACFVIGVEDTMDGICEALRKQMLIHKSGGGTGFNFSKLRYEGARVNSTNGRASGPISFMSLFDKATDTVQQGGMRRGANMGILNIDHHDIRKFIHCKDADGVITNFNLSIGMTDDFMQKAIDNPQSEEAEILAEIAESAWRTGDPGIIFMDTLNKDNPTPNLGPLECTNPCGESPLYPNEACNLGSINLAKMVTNGIFNYDRLRQVTAVATRFLDSVIDVNQYPLPEISAAVLKTRKIGLGIMGWADTLFQLRIAYNSDEALKLADDIMGTIHDEARLVSEQLGCEKGIPVDLKHLGRRNATLTCIAPTGTIALLADASSGIEPLFALEHTRLRTLTDGTKVSMKQKNRYYEEAINEGLPEEMLKKVFVTSHDVPPAAHVKMQGVFQKHVDLAVSKTINLVNSATVQDVLDSYVLAWKQGCKGITVYRDGSKNFQVLYTDEKKAEADRARTSAESATIPTTKPLLKLKLKRA